MLNLSSTDAYIYILLQEEISEEEEEDEEEEEISFRVRVEESSAGEAGSEAPTGLVSAL